MPHIRATARFIAFLDDYRKNNKLTREQALDQLLDHFLHTKPTGNFPDCERRLYLDGKNYCVQTSRKGLDRLREIPCPEVCHICIEVRWKIPKAARAETPIQTETDAKVRTDIAQGAMKRIKERGRRTNNIDMGDSEGVDPDFRDGYL